MCLIIVKPKSRKIPGETLARANASNPHGWGLLAKTRDGIVVERGYTTPNLLDAYMRHENDECVIHMRWATSGLKTLDMTHPFEITPNAWLFHNGIIRDIDSNDKTKSDTWALANLVLRPVFAEYPNIMDDDTFWHELGNRIKKGYQNKLVVVTSDAIRIVNEHFGLWFGGCWYSNDGGLSQRQIVQMEYRDRKKARTNHAKHASSKDEWNGHNPWYCGLESGELDYVRRYVAKHQGNIGYERAIREGRKLAIAHRSHR